MAELDPPEVTEVGEPSPESEQLATVQEDLAPRVSPTGLKLPTFKVESSCVLQNTCVTASGLFKLDPDGEFNAQGEARAIVCRQPRTEAEVEIFRQHAADCPVSAILEVPPES